MEINSETGNAGLPYFGDTFYFMIVDGLSDVSGRLGLNRLVFLVGLLIRAGLVALVTPSIQNELYLPFLLDVSGWLKATASSAAVVSFGPPFIFVFGCAAWLGKFLAPVMGPHLMFGATIMICDVILLSIVRRVSLRQNVPNFISYYWLSPVSIYVGYWHGSPHAFSAALLLTALMLIQERKYSLSGGVFGAAIASSPITGLVAPFFGLYFLGRSRLRNVAIPVVTNAAIVAGIFLLLAMLHPRLRLAYFSAPEIVAVLGTSFPWSEGLRIFVLPIAYIILSYIGWVIRGFNFELLWTFIGVLLTGYSLLTPSTPGVAVLALPFLAVHAMNTELSGRIIFWIFSISFVGMHLLISSGPVIFNGMDLSQPLLGYWPNGRTAASALLTMTIGSGALFVAQMLRRGVFRSYFYRSSRRPLGIGIAGDSGGGKDDLASSVIGLFGTSAVAHISGDNYHRWDRQRSTWRAVTHLNPKANDLETFSRDVAELVDGRWVRVRHYDHSTGKMSKQFRIFPREIVIASGLHALWVPTLTALYDVRIFLDMDESLRRFLKLRRDVRHRGHTAERVLRSIDQRWPDSLRFIQPQARFADLIFRLEPRIPSQLEDFGRENLPALRLVVQVPHEDDYGSLIRLLVAMCDVHAVEFLKEAKSEICVIGDPTRAEIAAVARRIISDDEMMATHPTWENGIRGVMQLFVLDRIERARKLRMRLS